MIRAVLAKDPDEPICATCARALGAQPTDDVVTVSPRACCVCGEERPCAAIRDWDWPAIFPKRRLHDEPGGYSELEALLSRPVSGVPSSTANGE